MGLRGGMWGPPFLDSCTSFLAVSSHESLLSPAYPQYEGFLTSHIPESLIAFWALSLRVISRHLILLEPVEAHPQPMELSFQGITSSWCPSVTDLLHQGLQGTNACLSLVCLLCLAFYADTLGVTSLGRLFSEYLCSPHSLGEYFALWMMETKLAKRKQKQNYDANLG